MGFQGEQKGERERKARVDGNFVPLKLIHRSRGDSRETTKIIQVI